MTNPSPIRRMLATAGLVLTLSAATVLVPSPAGAAAAPLAASPVAASAVHPITAAAPVRTAAVPAGFVRRVTPYWSWFGPRGWIGSYGVYGITVQSPNGTLVRDYGFSSTLCAPGATFAASAKNYLAGRRTALVRGSGARSWKWLSIGTVTRVNAEAYLQTVLFDATLSNGAVVRGRVTFTYAYTTGQYCYQSSDARTAPRAQFSRTIGTLNAIAQYTTYRGPGAQCTPTPTVTC